MELSRNSLEFFKKQAKKRRIPYQRMIRNLLDLYVARQKA
jgi:predicted DNA binding CopG/RHH family protein